MQCLCQSSRNAWGSCEYPLWLGHPWHTHLLFLETSNISPKPCRVNQWLMSPCFAVTHLTIHLLFWIKGAFESITWRWRKFSQVGTVWCFQWQFVLWEACEPPPFPGCSQQSSSVPSWHASKCKDSKVIFVLGLPSLLLLKNPTAMVQRLAWRFFFISALAVGFGSVTFALVFPVWFNLEITCFCDRMQGWDQCDDFGTRAQKPGQNCPEREVFFLRCIHLNTVLKWKSPKTLNVLMSFTRF